MDRYILQLADAPNKFWNGSSFTKIGESKLGCKYIIQVYPSESEALFGILNIKKGIEIKILKVDESFIGNQL